MERRSGAYEVQGSSETGRRPGKRPLLAGVEVREEDIEEQRGLDIAGIVFRVSSVVILLLAAYQFFDWWRNRPPGGAGMSVLIAETVQLVVVSFLLYGAADLADVMMKNHYEARASRILLARQTYLMRQIAIAEGHLPPDVVGDRRDQEPPEPTMPSGTAPPRL